MTKAARELRRLLKPTPPPMTQQGLADALGVTQQAVSAWLRGVTRPNYETRMKITGLLGVAIDDWGVDAPAESGALPADETDEHRVPTTGTHD